MSNLLAEGVLDYVSERQRQTFFSIPHAKLEIHCGPYGCGKTYALNLALGLACMVSEPPKNDSCIALIGKTAQSVKTNICNGLSSLWGDNFKLTTSRKDGYTKDAVLFGHRIRIVGLNDSNAEERIRGLNTYKVYGDEISTWGKRNFDLVQGRIRGKAPDGWVLGFIGSTNPDSPLHWLKKVIDEDSELEYISWTEHDNVTPNAKEYYRGLRERYKNTPAYLQRYVYGKWSASEGLVYADYNSNEHKIPYEEMLPVNNGLRSEEMYKYFSIGADFGTTNPTALLLCGVTLSNEVVVLDEVYLKDSGVREAREGLIKLLENNKGVMGGRTPDRVYLDPAAKVFKKELQYYGINYVESAKNDVEQGILKTKEMLQTGRLVITDRCKELEGEFLSYAWNPKSTDGKNLVIKEHDHACDALRYLIYTDEKLRTN